MIAALYIVAALAVLQGIIALIDGYRAARHVRTFRPGRARRERAVVFCPCKGLEHGLEENIRSLLEQDHPNYEVRFIVESAKDPAFELLKSVGAQNVLIAGKSRSRGQKVHNLACAVEQFMAACPPPGSPREVSDGNAMFVFCDSDARYPRGWLTSLTAVTGSIVATGYRWYQPRRFHFATLLRSAWNASVLSMLGDHRRNFAWGGSIAISQETFLRLRILEAWQGAVSDDYAVTRAAQQARVPIVFVPECVVPSYGECTFGELLEFTTRQIIITRVYHPALWRAGFLGHIIFNTAIWSMLFIEPAISAALFILAGWKSAVRLSSLQSVLPDPFLLKFRWFYILSPPLIGIIYLYNMIRSAAGTDIEWRQIRYRLVSPNETHVVGISGANES